jgi:hypothetical protein
VGLKSLNSLNLTNVYPNNNKNKNKNNKKKKNNKVKSKPLELRSRVKILVTANDFGSSKTNPGQRPKHHFCCGDIGKKVKYHKRGDLGK